MTTAHLIDFINGAGIDCVKNIIIDDFSSFVEPQDVIEVEYRNYDLVVDLLVSVKGKGLMEVIMGSLAFIDEKMYVVNIQDREDFNSNAINVLETAYRKWKIGELLH